MTDVKNLKIHIEPLIANSDNVLIFPHKDADFDAIASCLGVSLLSSALNKDSHIVLGDSVGCLYPGVQSIIEKEKYKHSIITLEQYEKEKRKNSLNIICDFNKPNPQVTRVSGFDRDKLVIIDHHEKDEETFDAILPHIDPGASSSSEITTALLGDFQINIPNDLANILLTGIILDTNRLTSNNVSGDTMRIGGDLLDSGATFEEAYEYFIEDFKEDRKVQRLIDKAKFIDSVGLVIGDQDIQYKKEELAKAAAYLLRFNINQAYAVGNIGDGIVSISARSKSKVNVRKIMRALNGGGTNFSAATKLSGLTVEEAGAKLMKLVFPKQIKNTSN